MLCALACVSRVDAGFTVGCSIDHCQACVGNSYGLDAYVGLVRSAEANENGTAAQRGVSWHPSLGWKWMPHHLSKDGLWQKIREEAKADAVSLLGRFPLGFVSGAECCPWDHGEPDLMVSQTLWSRKCPILGKEYCLLGGCKEFCRFNVCL